MGQELAPGPLLQRTLPPAQGDCTLTTLVWFKRDLRTSDHEPLLAAARLGEPVLPLYVIEPAYWQLDDTSQRQWAFICESLLDLDRQLRQLGSALIVRRGEITQVLAQLQAQHNFQRLFCHQETGGQWTFDRDRELIRWCRDAGVELREWQQFGVVRRLPDRDLWDRQWSALMRQPTQAQRLRLSSALAVDGVKPTLTCVAAADSRPCPGRQKGGSARGEALLQSFLERRSAGYEHKLSSPITAVRSCSRLSPHIAYGTVSLRRIYQQAREQGQHPSTLPRRQRSLTHFRSRLHWHCHFIQKLEDEPALEFRAMHRELESLKQGPNDSERLDRLAPG